MADASVSPPAHEAILQPDQPAAPARPAVIASPPDEPALLKDDVMIEATPSRPCGTIRVRLVYDGRSTPIPADDPWAE
jgi:hypothetical protein